VAVGEGKVKTMKVTRYVLTYGEKRSANYQTVSIEHTVEYEVEEGEDPREVFVQVRNDLVGRVRKTAEKAIEAYQ
jgi:hypothetical protein